MKNNWPETIDELLEQCNRLIDAYDLYTLGEIGKPLPGETEPRVDGTDYLAGEYQYGVGMIPAQWVTHVLEDSGTCCDEGTFNSWRLFTCSHCSVVFPLDAIRDAPSIGRIIPPRYCPNCGRKVIDQDARDLRDAIAADDGKRYSMQEVMDLMESK